MTIQKQEWQYLVEDVYDDFTLVPAEVPPNRLMTMNESLQYLKNYNSILKGEAIKKPNPWTLLAYMARRGSEGWEMVQATRLAQQIGTTVTVAYWRMFFKQPVLFAAPSSPRKDA